MKKMIGIALVLLVILTGCSKEAPKEVVETLEEEATIEVVDGERYINHGYYYTDGYIIDDIGEQWDYLEEDRYASKEEVYDGIVVYFVLNDNGTPENIYDDWVCTDKDGNGIVFDVNSLYTKIYDELEEELEEVDDWEITRDSNEITIKLESEEN